MVQHLYCMFISALLTSKQPVQILITQVFTNFRKRQNTIAVKVAEHPLFQIRPDSLFLLHGDDTLSKIIISQGD